LIKISDKKGDKFKKSYMAGASGTYGHEVR